ncbi:ribosome-inactivating protein bryodin II-like [Cucurbita pepo subsp. pepo]|uniref:ribosome-inactivating protein bryodin II-like n=1 Tax=Cucurbita pepo subsp. pepo TaxID=3664 RepID=UPI000C9D858B|nr:ribosome-inactivating protein bryodin II-like [Cucurbita pepo subsp. pepo]
MECIGSTQDLIQAPFPLNCGAHAAIRAPRPSANANLSFSLLGATAQTYKQFINDLRNALTVQSHKVYGIPVLPATAKGLARFILVNLTNYKGESITVAIDTVDVYIVAYQAGNKAYFLKDVSKEAHDVLFKGSKHETLSYKGNYDDLERHAGMISRENIELGFSELSSSIGNMFHYNAGYSVPRSFIVMIQMLSEASRFKYIETRNCEKVESKFKPDPGYLSLENRWSNLSEQVQKAQKHGGKFERPVQVRSVSNKPIKVTDVNSPVVKGIALLLCNKPGVNGVSKLMEQFIHWEAARGAFGIDF